jgi:hypothetical protein
MRINISRILFILVLFSIAISLKQNHFANKAHNSPKHQKPATTTPKPANCPPQVIFCFKIEYQKS